MFAQLKVVFRELPTYIKQSKLKVNKSIEPLLLYQLVYFCTWINRDDRN